MRVADVLAQRFSAAGIKHAFGIPGGEVLTLIDALGKCGIDCVTTRHEMGAGLMAQGVAVATGTPGLLVATVGPGLTNAVNAVANASLDRVPLIVVSGAVEQARPLGYTHQVLDQLAVLRPLVKGSYIATAESVARIAIEALELASAYPQGPVHIELSMQLAVREACEARGEDAEPTRSLVSSLAVRDVELRARDSDDDTKSALLRAARWLARSERPLILAGLEAVAQPAAAALADFVRATGIPVVTTYKAKGVIDERDPLCIGALGLSPKADSIAQPLLRSADIVLLVGYDPVEMRTAYTDPFSPNTRVIELTPCKREHDVHRAQLEIIGDLASTVEALRRAMRRESSHAPPPESANDPATRSPFWPDALPSRVRAALETSFSPASAPGFSPLAVADVLARNIPEDAYVTLDTGAHRIVASQVFRARWPGQIQQSNGLCTMGFALPAAMGLALASGRRAIAVMGDGGFDMLAGELATLRDLRLPVTCVIFDDSSLALIDLKQHAAGFERRGVWLGSTDHRAVARAFGGRGVRVHDVRSFEAQLVAALREPSGFSVISCALERGAYAGLI